MGMTKTNAHDTTRRRYHQLGRLSAKRWRHEMPSERTRMTVILPKRTPRFSASNINADWRTRGSATAPLRRPVAGFNQPGAGAPKVRSSKFAALSVFRQNASLFGVSKFAAIRLSSESPITC